MCDFDKLTAPFSADELEWRVQRSGIKNGNPWAIVVPYVQNRAIMDRLDSVVGPLGWENNYQQFNNGLLCGITIHDDGAGVTKWDGAPETQIESFKGGVSDAMKRAAVQWGIGRYLYRIPPQFANFSDNGTHRDKIKKNKADEGEWYKWDAPNISGLIKNTKAQPEGDKPATAKKETKSTASSKKPEPGKKIYVALLAALDATERADDPATALEGWKKECKEEANALGGEWLKKLKVRYSVLEGALVTMDNKEEPPPPGDE